MAVQQQATAWVVGNVAYPPDSAGKGGNHRVRLRVLNNRGWYDRTNREWVERPANGTEVICWGELARNAAASVEVGDPVVVFGRLEENLWTDAEGVSHKKTRVVADVVAHDLSRGQARFSRINLGAAGQQVGNVPVADQALDDSGEAAGDDAGTATGEDADSFTPTSFIDRFGAGGTDDPADDQVAALAGATAGAGDGQGSDPAPY